VLLSGCAQVSDEPAGATRAENGKAARSEVELGPVRVAVEVDPAKARLSDEPVLTLTIDYRQGVTVRKPPFGEALGDFIIRDFREPLPRIQGDREILEQVYTLEPTRTGKLPIDPIRVTFTDTRPDGDGEEHAVETEGLTIEVASVIKSEAPSLDALRPFAGPVAFPEPGGWGTMWRIALVPLIVAVGIIAWYLWKRSRKMQEEKQLSPGELAYLELQQIIEKELAEREVKLFYVELTGVVRRYIERTRGVHAPEQTTEEFLREISAKGTFPADESQRLKWFLESADLVKFAAHEPRKEDIEESFRRAKIFIGLERLEAAA
jgi:hypothetical protein